MPEKSSLDPYLLWAELTHYRDIALDAGGRVAVAIECHGTVAALQRHIDAGRLSGVCLPAFYRGGGGVDPARIHFCTAWVEKGQLQALSSRVKRFKLGMAVDRHAVEPPLGAGAHGDARVVVGIIDDFVAYAHRCFRDATGATRVRHVWSQDGVAPRSPDGTRWQPLHESGYGYELCPAGVGADALRSTYPAVLHRATHGTHVADLAAGAEPAGEAGALPDIVAVHLPRRGVADTSGSALKVQALDALHYIIRRAGPQAAVVVNLSYGTMAGPHDGTSILEQAIEELVKLRKGQLSVVVPAGNSYEARCHAVLRLNSKNRRRTLLWNVLPDDATPSYLEIWLPEGAAAHLRVKVTDPNGRSSATCRVSDVWPMPGGDPGQVDFAVIFLDTVADATQGTMVLVALAATRRARPQAVSARAGVWKVELSHGGTADLGEIHAWIERDDTLHGQPPRGRQSYFLDRHYVRPGRRPGQPPDNDQACVQRRGAFNTIATGGATIVVGAYVAKDGRVALYSGGGPARGGGARGTTLLASGDDSVVLHGLPAAATAGIGKVRMNGTSVAAPQITRQIADMLRQCPAPAPPRLSRAQILRHLRKFVHSGPRNDDPREGMGRFRRPVRDSTTSAPAAADTAATAGAATAGSRRSRGPSADG